MPGTVCGTRHNEKEEILTSCGQLPFVLWWSRRSTSTPTQEEDSCMTWGTSTAFLKEEGRKGGREGRIGEESEERRKCQKEGKEGGTTQNSVWLKKC